MKIILSHGYFLNEDIKELEIMRPYPTLGLLYISSFLKAHNQNVEILDSTFMDRKDWEDQIIEKQPDIIALYTNLMTKITVIELVEFVKTKFPKTKLIVGGPDVTHNLENYLNAGFDFGVIGEGEQTMVELCEAIANSSDFNLVSGIAFLEENNVVKTSERVKIKSIDELPLPDRESIPIEKYLKVWQEHHGKRTLNISTQRGCPYTCKWCSTAVYGQSYRRNSPKKVVEEIISMKTEFNVEALWFVDDVFTVSHKWMQELYDEFKFHSLKIPFECITRAERLNETVLMQLKEMGCFRIWIGAESGSQKIIDRMDRRVSLEVVKNMIQRTQEVGMEAGTFIMVGYPGENIDDVVLTQKYLKACNPNLLTITKAYPIKGTSLYSEVESIIEKPSNWNKSTDRDITIPLPYSDKFYHYAIRFLVNNWKANREKSFKHRLKSKIAFQLMKIHAR